MTDTGLPNADETSEALKHLEDFDRVLPRSIEDWVLERERDGLGVPDILKARLAEKARLREQIDPDLLPEETPVQGQA